MLLNWVKSGLLFGVMASVILMLCPNKSYMKHIGMVIGLLFILVMLHPLMELLHLDASTYASYIRNFLILETENEGFLEDDRQFYEKTIAAQLEAVFMEKGYQVNYVRIKVEEDGEVREVTLSFGEDVIELSKVEVYLHRMLGEDVRIIYE